MLLLIIKSPHGMKYIFMYALTRTLKGVLKLIRKKKKKGLFVFEFLDDCLINFFLSLNPKRIVVRNKTPSVVMHCSSVPGIVD